MPGYGLPHGSKGLLPWTWAERRLTRSRIYWIVTMRSDGAPHVMPVWGVWVERVFYFSTGARSRKARNLAANARCVVCTEDAAEAVIVEGVARRTRAPQVLRKLAAPYAGKYKPWRLDPRLGPVFAVRPQVAFGLKEKAFVSQATRWRL